MARALVKGETHLSRKDKKALIQMDLSEFDAVFREGHDKDYFKRSITSLYALFAIGHLVYGATYNRLYFSSEDFREKAEDRGIPFYDEIDAAIYETYEMVPLWKRVGLLLLSPFFAGFILGLVSRPLQWLFSNTVPRLLPQLQVVGVIAAFFLFGFAWALAYFLLIEGRVMYDRDEVMAEDIIRISNEEEYESILVTCGGNHRPGIASYLRDSGWKVEEETTDSPIGKILLWIGRLKTTVLNPRKTISRFISKLNRV